MFYLDRVSILNHHVPRTMPRVKAWTDSAIQERITIEMNTHRQYGFGKVVNGCSHMSSASEQSLFKIIFSLL